MNRHLTMTKGLVLSIVAAFATGAYGGDHDAATLRLFDYDRAASLDVQEASSRAERGCRKSRNRAQS